MGTTGNRRHFLKVGSSLIAGLACRESSAAIATSITAQISRRDRDRLPQELTRRCDRHQDPQRLET